MLPGDRLFCALIGNLHDGDTFTDWPPHITIVPWFRVDIANEELGRMIGQSLGDMEPFEVVIDSETAFGHRRKLANLVSLPSPLEIVGQIARGLLHEQDAWLVDETTKKQREFRPHVTVQKTGRVHEGETFNVDHLYIIEQKGDRKEVVSRIHL